MGTGDRKERQQKMTNRQQLPEALCMRSATARGIDPYCTFLLLVLFRSKVRIAAVALVRSTANPSQEVAVPFPIFKR